MAIAAAPVEICAADECGVDECRAGRIDFRNEDIEVIARGAGSVERARGGREVRRLGNSDNIGVSRCVHYDAVPELVACAAEERGVIEARIDDQFAIGVIAVRCEAVGMPGQLIAARDRHALSRDFLEGDRRGIAEYTDSGSDLKAAFRHPAVSRSTPS